MPAAEVEAYLARVPEPARTTLERVRAAIRSAAGPDAVECMSYGVPAFRSKAVIAAYAAFARHCGFYPMSPAVIEAFRGELAKYPTSKGAIRFPPDRPLPAALVKKLVKARLAEIRAAAPVVASNQPR